MKTIIILIFLFLSTIASATDYYVSSSGNDTNNGLSLSTPWKTIAKVNSSFPMIKAGDKILFNCGDTFYGALTISKSGTSGSPIILGAYGTGNKPIITGFTTISGWTDEGNGIYSKVISSESKTNMVTIDGVQYGMGRFPNTGWLTYESASTNVSITDNQLSGTPDWKGAAAVIEINGWSLDRCKITNHSGRTITYTNLGENLNANATGNYFIQDDLRTLDQFGEWYHDYSGTGKFYMYFGAVNPTTKVVQVATKDMLVGGGMSYVTIDNIKLSGSNTTTIIHWAGSNLTVSNCDIFFSGMEGIHSNQDGDAFENNLIGNTNQIGIVACGGTIINNTISNVGIIVGQTNNASSIVAIRAIRSNTTITGNNISNVYSASIFVLPNTNNIIIQNNYITNTCIGFTDSGAIYTVGNHTSFLIDKNIIDQSASNGIYLDEYCNGVTVSNNTVYKCFYNGIKLHKAHDNTIKYNTCYDNGYSLDLESNPTTENNLRNNSIYGNKFIAKGSTQKAVFYINRYTGYAVSFSTMVFDQNYYARPIEDNLTFETILGASGTWSGKTFAQWKTLVGQDANSYKSPIGITSENDLRFEYNATAVAKTVTLAYPMMDITGTKYTTSANIQPFSSVVLMKDPNPTAVATGYSFAGPTAGNINSASGNFTVTPNNSFTGTITITPSGAGSTGLSAKVLTFSNSSAAQNFTITPTVAGSITLTPSNNGSLTNPAVLTYTSNAIVPNAPTSVVATAGNSQSFFLKKGYNLISTYITASDPNVMSVTKSLYEEGNLIKMLDESGNSFEYGGSSLGWINKIGSIEKTKGYIIQVAENCTFQVTGSLIVLPLDIALETGWNIISFPYSDVADANAVIQSLIDQNKLLKVQDEEGNSIENWGAFGGWIDGIGNFAPGKAYKVNVVADAVLTLEQNYYKSISLMYKSEKLAHFKTSIEGNGSDHMNINIVGLSGSGISIGDELAAFDGDICVGALKITDNNLITGSASLIASFSSNDQANDGFKEGHTIDILTWNHLSGSKTKIQAEVINGKLIYLKSASVLLKMKTLNSNVKNLEDNLQIDLFPNPCLGKVTVRFSQMPEVGSRIDIMDISGRMIMSRQISDTSEEFDLESLSSGLYLVKTVFGSYQKVHKLIIRK